MELGRHVVAFEQLQKERFRIGVDEDRRGVDRRAVAQLDASRAAVAQRDAFDGAAGAQLGTGSARGGGSGCRDGAHAPAHESPRALHAERAAGIVVREHVGGAGIARPGARADQPVGRERGLQHRRAHVALDEIRDGALELRARRSVET
jgi:hypothetical protein